MSESREDVGAICVVASLLLFLVTDPRARAPA
jgi:hypothetical protein